MHFLYVAVITAKIHVHSCDRNIDLLYDRHTVRPDLFLDSNENILVHKLSIVYQVLYFTPKKIHIEARLYAFR